MKRCKLSYDECKCIISKKISGMAIQNNYINGYIGWYILMERLLKMI